MHNILHRFNQTILSRTQPTPRSKNTKSPRSLRPAGRTGRVPRSQNRRAASQREQSPPIGCPGQHARRISPGRAGHPQRSHRHRRRRQCQHPRRRRGRRDHHRRRNDRHARQTLQHRQRVIDRQRLPLPALLLRVRFRHGQIRRGAQRQGLRQGLRAHLPRGLHHGAGPPKALPRAVQGTGIGRLRRHDVHGRRAPDAPAVFALRPRLLRVGRLRPHIAVRERVHRYQHFSVDDRHAVAGPTAHSVLRRVAGHGGDARVSGFAAQDRHHR
mmetsp:Transcript_20682/g.43516  ORF Transcript_20682/g.43516 Transcript_20682/m.43516 type:complete len:270 (+) Transcript_20682:311-1120(+)